MVFQPNFYKFYKKKTANKIYKIKKNQNTSYKKLLLKGNEMSLQHR